jgi:hypothetical protein
MRKALRWRGKNRVPIYPHASIEFDWRRAIFAPILLNIAIAYRFDAGVAAIPRGDRVSSSRGRGT